MQVIMDPSLAYQTLKDEKVLALDLETSGLSPFQDAVAVVSLWGPETQIPCVLHTRGRFPDALIALFKQPRKYITHNGTSFDLLFLKKAGFEFVDHYDTLIGEQVLNTQARHDRSNKLSATLKRRTGQNTKLQIAHGSWMNERLTVNQVKYCVEDIRLLYELMLEQQALAEKRGLTEALAQEQKLTLCTAKMEYRGIRCDLDALEAHNAAMVKAGQESYQKVSAAFGPFNVNAPAQVVKVFKANGYDLPNAQAATLESLALREPLAMDVVTAKRGGRQYSAYGPNSKFAAELDGNIIHTRYWQIGAETTRYTSSNPNMQQIPRPMRKVFRAESGYKVVKVDWSQLEVRVGAHISNDPALIEVCRSSDVHSMMGSTAFKVPYDTFVAVDEEGNMFEPYKTQRQQSKACTFIWLFDGGIPGIVDWAFINHIDGVTGGVASNMLLGMRQTFLGVNKFHQNCRELARQKGVVRVGLPWGHERQFVGSKLNTQIANTFIQGTAAIIMKQAILDLDAAGLLDYIGLTVHDEVVSTCVPANEAEEYALEVKSVMENSGMSICHRVPIVAEATVKDTWT